ncbi:hypothetical protein [Nocardia cyriacigeorgica]|uniref:hypothetical protein n=1 Tax=Nocardia cyriacigeorgica TaxID=135487 RepID=UPI00189341C4|nr:hypothetical protein [Nocardia cyriacigeorgica]MBF6416962.1 hypothetical protein [Nocardia cyriacigeorgica]
MATLYTDRDARHAIITAIEANGTDIARGDEFDITAIIEDVYAATGGYNVEAMEHDPFWAAVERHAL